ncbi:MAG: hypothetical protein ACKOXV_06905 [Bacteroidota bacterium]
MNEVPLLSPTDIDAIQIYWVFVNPLNGRYAKFTKTSSLAVFVSEEAGREWEKISKTLQRYVGHEETLDRIKEIANEQTDGRYEILS